MPQRGGIGMRRWLFYVAVLAAWLLGAELMVVTSLGRSLPGRVPAFAGWAFVVVSAAFIIGVVRWEVASRSRANRLVSQLNAALGSMTALTEASLSMLPLDELLNQLVDRLQAVAGADLVAVLLFSDDGEALLSRAVHSSSSIPPPSSMLEWRDGLVGRTLESRELCESSGTKDVANLSSFGHVLASAVACAIVVKGRSVGLCLAGKVDSRRFDERELHLLRLVADHAGLGIERARRDDTDRRSLLAIDRARRSRSCSPRRGMSWQRHKTAMRRILPRSSTSWFRHSASGVPFTWWTTMGRCGTSRSDTTTFVRADRELDAAEQERCWAELAAPDPRSRRDALARPNEPR